MALAKTGVTAFCVMWLWASGAGADEASTARPDAGNVPAAGARVARLGVFLRGSAHQAHAGRRAVIVTGVVGGAAMIPIGVALWKRSDPVSQSIGAGFTIGGAAPLAFSALSLFRSQIERLRETYEQQIASGTASDDFVRATETEWAGIAATGHDRRMVTGVVGLGLGGIATAIGIGLLLDGSVAGLSRNSQNTIGSVLVSSGVAVLSVGLRALIQESAEESWSEAYLAAGGWNHASGSLRRSAVLPDRKLRPNPTRRHPRRDARALIRRRRKP